MFRAVFALNFGPLVPWLIGLDPSVPRLIGLDPYFKLSLFMKVAGTGMDAPRAIYFLVLKPSLTMPSNSTLSL